MTNNTYVGPSPIHGSGLFASKSLRPGDLIAQVDGYFTNNPTTEERRISVQVDHDLHFVPRSVIDFINHSCAPNAYVEYQDGEVTLVTVEPVEKDEEITIDYCTTDLLLGHPFGCNCKTNECLIQIRGFKDLSSKERLKRKTYVMPYLRYVVP